jgi:2-dehydro-3-deoxyphosphogluconate aldolase / (4S)-4-hydroxy-2-oxoglutarate aldolase
MRRIERAMPEFDDVARGKKIRSTEIITAWKAGADFVKIFPTAPVGGPHYVRALKAPRRAFR